MEHLYPKVVNFQENEFDKVKDVYKQLENSQSPKTLVVSCADSRVLPNQFSQAGPGEIFSIRNAGNLIPAYSEGEVSNEALTLEYGVEALEVKEIVICGHSKCGAMGGVLDFQNLSSLPLIQKGLSGIHSVFQQEFKAAPELSELIEWNVRKQMENVLSYPFVKKRVEAGQLSVWGWVWDFVDGKISYKISSKDLANS